MARTKRGPNEPGYAAARNYAEMTGDIYLPYSGPPPPKGGISTSSPRSGNGHSDKRSSRLSSNRHVHSKPDSRPSDRDSASSSRRRDMLSASSSRKRGRGRALPAPATSFLDITTGPEIRKDKYFDKEFAAEMADLKARRQAAVAQIALNRALDLEAEQEHAAMLAFQATHKHNALMDNYPPRDPETGTTFVPFDEIIDKRQCTPSSPHRRRPGPRLVSLSAGKWPYPAGTENEGLLTALYKEEYMKTPAVRWSPEVHAQFYRQGVVHPTFEAAGHIYYNPLRRF